MPVRPYRHILNIIRDKLRDRDKDEDKNKDKNFDLDLSSYRSLSKHNWILRDKGLELIFRKIGREERRDLRRSWPIGFFSTLYLYGVDS
jgi:hypothetical protein